MVPTPNWYSRRMASNSSTSFLLFKPSPFGLLPETEYPVRGLQGGQIKPSKWANLQYRSGPFQTSEIKQILAQPKWANKLTARDLRALTPLIWDHVNPYGRFELDMNDRLPLE